MQRPASTHCGRSRQSTTDRAEPAIPQSKRPGLDNALITPVLETQLHCQLHEARRSRLDDLAESSRAKIAVHGRGAEELSMVKCVEGFKPELQRGSLGEREGPK